MSLESNIAALVAASTGLTQAVNITKATVEATRDSAIAKEAPVTTAKDAVLASTTAATTDASTTGTKLAAAAADYATQKNTKGLAAVQTSAESELKDRLHRRDPARHPFRGARPSLVMDFVRRECHRNNAAGNLEPVDLNTFMTFTRASTGTYVGPDGLIKEAASNVPRYGYDPVTGEALGLLVEEQRTNLFPYSAYPASASAAQGWNRINCDVYPNVAVAPDGTMTAAKAVVSVGAATTGNDGVGVFATPGVTSSATHSLTLYVKNAGAGYLRVRESITTGQIAKVNLTTGAITAEAGYTTATFTVTATDVGNGWWRVAVVRTPTTTFRFNLKPGIDVGDGVSGIYIWGAQLEAGAFPTSYIPTPATFTGRASTKTYFDSNGVMQTAASGVAATDYGYVDGRWISKGLSLEGQATNVALYSSGTTLTGFNADTTTSTVPSTISGIALTQFLSSGGMARRIGFFGTALAKGDVVASLYLKKQNGSVVLGFSPWEGSTGNSTTVVLDMGTGAGVLAKGLHTTAVHAVQDCGGLWRLSVALTYGAGNCTLGTFFFTTATTTDVTLGGLQAESGPVATSYIPTTTAKVTRAADTSTSAQVTRAQDWAFGNDLAGIYNHEEGTFFVESAVPSATTALAVLGFYSSLVTPAHFNSLTIYNSTTRCGVEGLNGGVLFNSNVGTPESNVFNKSGMTYKKGRYLSMRDGQLSAVNTTAPLLRNINRMTIGFSAYSFNVRECANGCIRQITYFPRQLSDADLQALTILED